MKIIKKILRIICIILPCFGVVLLNSSNSFAKEYTIDRIPAINVHLGSAASLYSSFTINFGSNTIPSGLKLASQTAILSEWDSNLGICKYSSTASSTHSFSPEYSIGVSGFYDKYYPTIPASRCNNIQFYQSGLTPSNSSTAYNFGSFSSSGSAFLLGQLTNSSTDKFYPFEYRYFDAHDVEYVKGVKYSNFLHIGDLLGTAPGKFKSLTIPFDIDSDLIGGYQVGRQVEFKGSFNFPAPQTTDSNWRGVSFEWAPDYSTNAYFRLHYEYFTSSFINKNYGFVNCLVSRTVSDSLTSSGGSVTLSYSCPVTLPADSYEHRSYGFQLEIGTTGTYVWNSDYDWSFNALYVVTDNDSSPGGGAVSPQIGSNPDNAPGSALNPSESLSFWDKLNSMINIQMLNPFLPLLGAFSDSSTCHNLPVLHQYANFPEQICQFYPEEVYNLTTPVFMLLPTMIVFSYLMYWVRNGSTELIVERGTHK